jgi:large subunit ribosomal protein L19
VYYEIKEGEKLEHSFQRSCYQRRGSGNTETFTIRKMSGSVGVERIFPKNLPALQKLKSTKGAVRRARIFYFRELTGKSKIKDKEDSQTSLYHKSPISHNRDRDFSFLKSF